MARRQSQYAKVGNYMHTLCDNTATNCDESVKIIKCGVGLIYRSSKAILRSFAARLPLLLLLASLYYLVKEKNHTQNNKKVKLQICCCLQRKSH